MTSPLVEAVSRAAGQPASVRVGIVDSVNPLIISVQGAPMVDVGVLNSFVPQVGNPVILLGQSPASGADPASWVCLGTATPAGMTLFQGISTLTFTLTAAEQAVPGTFLEFTTTAPVTLVEAQWTADFNIIGATITTGVCRPIVDGVISTVQAILEMPVAAATGRWTLGNQALYRLDPGVHTIELTALANIAGNISLVAGSTNLLLRIHG